MTTGRVPADLPQKPTRSATNHRCGTVSGQVDLQHEERQVRTDDRNISRDNVYYYDVVRAFDVDFCVKVKNGETTPGAGPNSERILVGCPKWGPVLQELRGQAPRLLKILQECENLSPMWTSLEVDPGMPLNQPRGWLLMTKSALTAREQTAVMSTIKRDFRGGQSLP